MRGELKEGRGTRGKDATGKPLNHEGSFHPGRWGISVSTPPRNFWRTFPKDRCIGKIRGRGWGRREEDGENPSNWWAHESPHLSRNSSRTSRYRPEDTKLDLSAVKIRSRPREIKDSSKNQFLKVYFSSSHVKWFPMLHIFQNYIRISWRSQWEIRDFYTAIN